MRRILASCFALLVFGGAGPPPSFVVDPSPDAREPQVAVDGKGRVYVAYGRGDKQIALAISVDGGKSFETSLVTPAHVTHLGMRRGPRVAASNSAVVVAAIGKEATRGDVLAWRSVDRGKSWQGPARLNSQGDSAREGLHALAAGPGDAMFCAWLDLRNKRTEIYGTRSADGGATWEPDQLVYRAPEKSICQCCHPTVAYAPDGTLYVMFRNDVGGSRDLYLARSGDGGKTFTPAEKLGNKTWKIAFCPMDGGSIALGPDGRVETAWTRASEVFAAKPGDAERSLGRGIQPWTAFGPDGPATVWLEKRSGELYASPSPLADRLTLDSSANDPVVAAAPGGRGPVVAAWEKPGQGIRAQLLAPEGK